MSVTAVGLDEFQTAAERARVYILAKPTHALSSHTRRFHAPSITASSPSIASPQVLSSIGRRSASQRTKTMTKVSRVLPDFMVSPKTRNWPQHSPACQPFRASGARRAPPFASEAIHVPRLSVFLGMFPAAFEPAALC